MKNVDRYWQDRYFSMLVNDKSMSGLANAFYPLWGLLRKFRMKNIEIWIEHFVTKVLMFIIVIFCCRLGAKEALAESPFI